MASLIATVVVLAVAARAQDTAIPNFTPLASRHFTYTALPYQADTDTGDRGTQFGYNICNSTTQNQQSLCQTAVINGIDDFCLWGPPDPNSLIGNTEGEAVAWCTKPGYGTRLIPEGALTGVQFIKTPAYVQITGLIKQEFINIAADDSGGEMDPHGADQRGNPLGGLLFSSAFNGQMTQAIEWHNFMGGNAFCLKACDPAGKDAARYCEHVYDRIGCQYNAPAAYEPGAFLSCAGENQDFPGIYTDAAGAVQTYQQPPESLGEIQTLPYVAKIPATSQCTTYTSAELYKDAPSASVKPGSSTSSGTGSKSGSATRTSTRSGASSSATSSGAASGGVAQLKVSSGLVGSLAVVVVSFVAALAL